MLQGMFIIKNKLRNTTSDFLLCWCTYVNKIFPAIVMDDTEDIQQTRYRDRDGYEVIVLDNIAKDWTFPWWLWLILGVLILILLTCVASALLRAIGIITDDRDQHKWVLNLIKSKYCVLTFTWGLSGKYGSKNLIFDRAFFTRRSLIWPPKNYVNLRL